LTTSVDRRQVLAYRASAQGLHREGNDPAALAVLDLGVQDTPPGSAAQALAARLRSSRAGLAAEPGLRTTWTVRGAPHVHRAAELEPLARALWPLSDDDALARLDTSSSPVRASGMAARDALRLVAGQLADIVTEPMPKGDASTALTLRIPSALTVDCRRCRATHIVETLFRTAVLPAGIAFAARGRGVTFEPIPAWAGVPHEAAGTEHLVAAYLRLHGPATRADVAAFLGTKPAALTGPWPDELAEVVVDGQPRSIPAAAVDDLLAAPDPPGLRLLPPSDPWLQARDRDFVVPDRAHSEALWPILGRPGAVLVDGEIAGVWRARKAARRLDVTVTPFRRLAAAPRRSLDDEAARLAAARGVSDAAVELDG
jgi:hypothetical protein